MTARDPQRWLESPEAPLSYEQRSALEALSVRAPNALARERMLAQLAKLTAIGATSGSEQIGQVGGRVSGALVRAGWLACGAAVLSLAWLALWTGAHTGSVEPEHTRVPRQTVVERLPSPEAVQAAPLPLPSAISPPALQAPRAKLTKARVVEARGTAPEQNQAHEASRAEQRAGDPVAELALLTPARKLLVTNPARALALSDEHALRFPRGVFAEERAFLRVEALLRLGRRSDADVSAAKFRRTYPASTYLERLHELISARP